MITATVLAQVLACYDLGELRSTVSAYRGFVNETAFIQTDEGQFVVRRNHRQSRAEERIYRHRLMRYLREHGLPAPALIPTKDGETLLELEGRTYEISEFVQGEAFNPARPDQAWNLGHMLARYHQVTRNYPPPPGEVRPRYSPQNVLAVNETLVQRDVMGDLSDTLAWYDGRAARLRKQLSDETYRALPHSVIHGDIHSDNVIFHQDEVVALLDYDQVEWDTPLADLADALVAFASVERNKVAPTNWGVFPGALDEERAALLMAGYAQVSPLSKQELELLPTLVEVLWLQGEMGRVHATPEGAPDYHLEILNQGLGLSFWINERREDLIERWQQIMDDAQLKPAA